MCVDISSLVTIGWQRNLSTIVLWVWDDELAVVKIDLVFFEEMLTVKFQSILDFELSMTPILWNAERKKYLEIEGKNWICAKKFEKNIHYLLFFFGMWLLFCKIILLNFIFIPFLYWEWPILIFWQILIILIFFRTLSTLIHLTLSPEFFLILTLFFKQKSKFDSTVTDPYWLFLKYWSFWFFSGHFPVWYICPPIQIFL